MNNNYTEHIKNILNYSNQEASRLHSQSIRPEHFMLGIIRDGKGKAVEALERQGVDLAQLRMNIEYMLREDLSNTPLPESALKENVSRECDRALKLSQLEARMMRHNSIDTEHLVLALLKDNSSNLSQLLQLYDVNYKTFFDTLQEMESGSAAKGDANISDFSGPDPEEEEDDDEETADEDKLSHAFSPTGHQQIAAPRSTVGQGNSNTPTIDRFGFDVTEAARQGKLDPVIGREIEIERLAQILSRRKKNNPVLLGEPGVGKTAIVEGLAQRIADNKVSFLLRNKRVISLDMAGMVAGTKYRGQFEERIKGIISEASSNPDIILYIDEIHNLVGAGNAAGSMDAANMLKPALSRGELQCIGSTTLDEYRKSIEKDGALERRFQKVMVEPTSAADTLAILHNLRSRYEEHHCVRFSDEALQACVTLSERYISDRKFPDKAIDVLDEAGSRMHLSTASESKRVEELEKSLLGIQMKKDEAIINQHYEEAATYRDQERKLEEQLNEARREAEAQNHENAPIVDADKISEVVAQITGIPVQKVASSESQKLLHLKETLQANVIGQDDAIQKVVRAIQRNRIGLKDPNRPIGTFLFLGPTGVGKTYLAKRIADELFASRDSLIRIDMSEYMEKQSTSRLIGAAPGYVGYEEGGQLTERVRRHPYSVVLFDEIEKADHEVFNLLLQLFDEGHLTDASGRKIDFKNCIIILTSNVGSRQLGEFGTGIGFQNYTANEQQAANEAVIRKELKKTFSPEFLNRIDDIITFRQLTQPDIRRIVDVELQTVLSRIANQGYEVEVTEAMKDFLARQGYDPKMGARPLRRAIQQHIEDALCERLLTDADTGQKETQRIVIDAPGSLS